VEFQNSKTQIAKFFYMLNSLLREFQKYIFNISVTKPSMEVSKLPSIGTLLCYSKNGNQIFETPVN